MDPIYENPISAKKVMHFAAFFAHRRVTFLALILIRAVVRCL